MSALVTGGAGFIGSTLVRALIGGGDSVVTVDKLTYAGNLDNLGSALYSPRHRFVNADVCDRAAIAAVLGEHRPTTLYHLAAESHVDSSIDGPLAFVETNVLGTATLLEAALDYWRRLDSVGRGQFRLVQVSTDEVYGELGSDGYFDETSRHRPNSPYAATKAGADHLARAWWRTYGLPVVISNASNTYGPYQFPEKLIPLTVLNAVAGRELSVYGSGRNIRDWLHVDDHVTALWLIGESGRAGRTYLVGAQCEKRNIDIVHTICRLLDARRPEDRPHARPIAFVPDRPGHDARYAIDPRKIERELGWRPRRGFEEGLAATVDWYLANPEWCRRAGRGDRQERLGAPAARCC